MTTVLIQILGLGIIILLFNYRHKQLQYQKTISNIKAEKEKSILAAQIEIQEETIQNISREIHDNIGLSLTLAKLNLTTLSSTIQFDYQEKISSTTNLLSIAISDLRSISHGLNNEVIKTFGLLRALENEVERIKKNTYLDITLEIIGEQKFIDANKELLLFRMIQESINNVLKHSKATECRIKIHYKHANLETSIWDNGTGMENKNSETNKGSGLLTMGSRLALIGGNLEISSSNEGTEIKIILLF